MTLRWFDISSRAGFMVLLILAASLVAAPGFVVMVAGTITGDEDDGKE